MPDDVVRAEASARVPAPPAAVRAALLADPPPEVQARMGIEAYQRLGPGAWTFRQRGQEVQVRVARDEPGLLAMELDRGGAVQRQAFALAPHWLGGTRVTLTVELPAPAPRAKLRGYLRRTLALLRERAGGR